MQDYALIYGSNKCKIRLCTEGILVCPTVCAHFVANSANDFRFAVRNSPLGLAKSDKISIRLPEVLSQIANLVNVGGPTPECIPLHSIHILDYRYSKLHNVA